jgi:hypothetical protein
MSEHFDVPERVQEERQTMGSPTGRLLLAIAAGLGAAIVGGVVWGYVVKWSDYEVGIVAWAIGFATGSAVLAAARRKGADLQAVAIACSLFGILLGKYLSFALLTQDAADTFGVELGLFSGDMVDLFRESIGDVFGLFDLLWTALAVASAWRLLRPEPEPGPEPEPPSAATPPATPPTT